MESCNFNCVLINFTCRNAYRNNFGLELCKKVCLLLLSEFIISRKFICVVILCFSVSSLSNVIKMKKELTNRKLFSCVVYQAFHLFLHYIEPVLVETFLTGRFFLRGFCHFYSH